MKKLTLVYILILLFALWMGLKITDTPGYNTPSGTYEIKIDEPASYSGIVDSTEWVSIDTVYGDTILTIDNSNYYRWYKVEGVGSGGPMVIHGTWINHKDSTITEFTITE